VNVDCTVGYMFVFSYLLISGTRTPLNLHIARELKVYIRFVKTHL